MAATERMYLGLDGKVVNNSNHFGPLAVGVPGTVAGLYLAHQRLGSMAWSDLVQPAVELARNGIPITYSLQTGLKEAPAACVSIRLLPENSSKQMDPSTAWARPGCNPIWHILLS